MVLTFGFELKVSQGMKTALSSRTPEGNRYEIAGHVLFYFLVRWMMVEAVHGQDPLRLSFTQALRELQDISQTLIATSDQRVSQVLLPRLPARVAEHVVSERPRRHHSRPHDTKVRITGSGERMMPGKLPADGQLGKRRAKQAA